MNSSEHPSTDPLDVLIRRALVESVAGEEPSDHVWNRIRAELTKPRRRPAVRWSGAVLQAALLLVILVFGSTVVWEERLGGQPTVVSPRASATVPLTTGDADNAQTSPNPSRAGTLTVRGDNSSEPAESGVPIVMDTAKEIALLREVRAAQRHSLEIEEQRSGVPGVAVSTDDIPPHPDSPQARALYLSSQIGAEPAEVPPSAPNATWQ